MQLITRKTIETLLPSLDLLPAIEQGFTDYSRGKAVVPPVGELLFDQGEVHIKYGYVKGDDHYIIKIASGFYTDPGAGRMLPGGMMLLFSQSTGQPVCCLQDEGLLTNIRTAVAGAIVARYLAPSRVSRIGIVGAGTQGRLQLRYLREVVDCNRVLVWGTGPKELEQFRKDMENEGYSVETTEDATRILELCNLVITATPSTEPLLKSRYLRPGTHITAMGSDTPGKQELDPQILSRADLVVADSIQQCRERGEIYQSTNAGMFDPDRAVELGHITGGKIRGRVSEDQITVADLTGVAVQDMAIAAEVFRAFKEAD